jgi:hypothetical protein
VIGNLADLIPFPVDIDRRHMSPSEAADTGGTVYGRRGALSWLAHFPVLAGAGSGLVAAVGMGVVLQFGADAMPLVGALYGQESVLVGWIAHLFNGVALGVVFAGLVTRTPVARIATSRETVFGLGVGYGAVLGLISGGLLFPFALQLAGVSTVATPFLPLPGLVTELVTAASLAVGHLVYGGVLGALVGLADVVEE